MENARNDGENYLDLDSLRPCIKKSQKRLREKMRIGDSVYAPLPLVFENIILPRVLHNIERCTICKRNVESCRLGHCPREKMEEDLLMNESCASTCSSLNVESGVVESKDKGKKTD
ncbi:hypothetical protein CTI12_AA168780 [Artemisia annua]|uniref:Uncharacterized protein n=1 Tax=Artemisia annua TaxID=35608 RepID=A0A2U1PCB6_ARTAN|nr:hypothetical protein CTI12_AA168780 [Artemisia annua]